MAWPVSVGTRVYIVALAGIAAGLITVGFGYWRRGLVVVGATMVCLAIARWFVSEDHLGALGVRARWFDVLWLGGLGFSLVGLALVVPPSVISL